MTEEQRNYLYQLWCEETNDPETEEWRENLTPEETAVVEEWDEKFDAGYLMAMERISR